MVESEPVKKSKEKKDPESKPISDPLSGGGGGGGGDPLSASDPLSAVLMDPLSQAAATSSFAAPVKVGRE